MAKKKMKEQDTLAWMTTFTNLMILLLAFFIVLVTLGTVDQNKKQKAFNSLFGSFGFKTGGQSILGSREGSDVTMPQTPMKKEGIAIENLKNITLANGLQSDIKIQKEAARIIIAISNRVLFSFRSNKIQQKSVKFLSELSDVLKNGPGLIELRGYTDRAETILDPEPARKSIYLSIKRSLAVMHFFIDKAKIPANRIVAHGFGSPPLNKGRMQKMKKGSGGVSIIIDSRQELPYSLRRVKKRGGLLDYRGFLFKQ